VWNDGATEVNTDRRPLQIFRPVTGPVPICLSISRHSKGQQTLQYYSYTECLHRGLIGK